MNLIPRPELPTHLDLPDRSRLPNRSKPMLACPQNCGSSGLIRASYRFARLI
jgi:hypothetical protein